MTKKKFYLQDSFLGYQLTIHFNNLISHYGRKAVQDYMKKNSKDFQYDDQNRFLEIHLNNIYNSMGEEFVKEEYKSLFCSKRVRKAR